MNNAPIVIEFFPGSRIGPGPEIQESAFRGDARIAGCTSVTSADGQAFAEIPSDQIVFGEATGEFVRIGLGGMSFEGIERENLVFWRVRDLLPIEEIGSGAPDKVLIKAALVSSLRIQGAKVWPLAPASPMAQVMTAVTRDT